MTTRIVLIALSSPDRRIGLNFHASYQPTTRAQGGGRAPHRPDFNAQTQVAKLRVSAYSNAVRATDSTAIVSRTLVTRVADLPPRRTVKFVLERDGRALEAFALNHDGALVAYVNRCCHVPMTLDWVENQFLSEDAAHIMCATHGAVYDPLSGECVAGPPIGRCLTPIPLEVRDGEIYAGWPDGE